MKLATRILATTFAALAMAVAAAPADARGRHGGHWGPGPFWGGVGIGLGVGLASYYYRPWYPGYVVVEPPAYYYEPQPMAQPVPHAVPREPVARPAPDPIFYPRSGQSAAQTEADRVDCNRWATTQPSAMSDASVFQRATLACMEGRGYVVR
jgi:hypothetical protein